MKRFIKFAVLSVLLVVSTLVTLADFGQCWEPEARICFSNFEGNPGVQIEGVGGYNVSIFVFKMDDTDMIHISTVVYDTAISEALQLLEAEIGYENLPVSWRPQMAPYTVVAAGYLILKGGDQ